MRRYHTQEKLILDRIKSAGIWLCRQRQNAAFRVRL